MKRGDLYWADLIPRSGSEQRGRRPVLIVSHDGFNQVPGWRFIMVVPISTPVGQAILGPTAIHLPKGIGGLKKESIALCHQVTTLDRSKLTETIGTLSPDLLEAIEEGLRATLNLQ
jgi:mRNA interferase MazF